ncbi:transcriptional regulator, partial [Novosphingobium album (ex Liu et al. 2023)]
MTDSPKVEPLQRAIRALGSQTALGRLIGISQQGISKMVRHSRPLPAEHVLTVEAATGISRHELRPDIYPIETPRSSGTPPGDASAAANPRTAAAG